MLLEPFADFYQPFEHIIGALDRIVLGDVID